MAFTNSLISLPRTLWAISTWKRKEICKYSSLSLCSAEFHYALLSLMRGGWCLMGKVGWPARESCEHHKCSPQLIRNIDKGLTWRCEADGKIGRSSSTVASSPRSSIPTFLTRSRYWSTCPCCTPKTKAVVHFNRFMTSIVRLRAQCHGRF